MDNVVAIPGFERHLTEALEPAKVDPDPLILDLLEMTRQRVIAGEIVSIAVVYALECGGHGGGWAGMMGIARENSLRVALRDLEERIVSE